LAGLVARVARESIARPARFYRRWWRYESLRRDGVLILVIGGNMRGSRIAGSLGLLATLVVAALAATVSPAAGGTTRAAAAQPTDSVQIRFAVTKFAARGKHLVAIGQTITTYQTAQGAYSTAKPFAANVLRIHKARTSSMRSVQSATRICDVLNLTLGPLHLALLGLIVDLNQVVLTIKADSQGGLLGSLLCGLAGGAGTTPTTGLTKTATRLTKVAKSSGLATAGPALTLPLQTVTRTTQQAAAVCTVLDLTLGPLDLNLLGLMVHLGGGATGTDPVHLTITADPTGGLLGSLLCSLAGGLPTG
jgi:hypothetical protein